MAIIQVLDPTVSRQIRAGECIRRPASVIKELVDNALDAGATRIEVDIENGGIDEIRISDNGCGMTAEDAPIAFLPHATSKIRSVDDLIGISTMGFRGEALDSIASAAGSVTLTTRHRDDLDGVATEVLIRDGGKPETRSTSRQVGTTVLVRQLFAIVPARRKHLKTPRSEANQVLQTLITLAFTRSDVHFVLRESGRIKLDAPPVTSMKARIGQIYGPEYLAKLIPVDAFRDNASVHGYVVAPSEAPGSTRRSQLLVNGRPFEDPRFGGILYKAYEGTLPRGAKPEWFLHFSVPDDQIDVNVHPEKVEIRFADSSLVPALTRRALRGALMQFASVPGALDLRAEEPAILIPEADRFVPVTLASVEQATLDFGPLTAPPTRLASPGIPADPAAVFQIANTFLVCPIENGMLIVDQHAAHERIRYQHLLDQWMRSGRSLEAQGLALPPVFHFTADEASRLEASLPALQRLGFDLVGSHDGRTFILNAVPVVFTEGDYKDTILTLLDESFAEADEAGDGEITAAEEKTLQTLACHSAIRAGQPLTRESIRALWQDMLRTDLSAHDIHGRPAMDVIPAKEMAARLGRDLPRSSHSRGPRRDSDRA